MSSTLVQRSFLIFVLYSDQGPCLDKILGNVCVAPEAGVVQRSVAVLVDAVDLRLLPDEDGDHVPVAVGGGQVEGGVVPHVGGVHPRPPADQHLQDLQVAPLGCPV